MKKKMAAYGFAALMTFAVFVMMAPTAAAQGGNIGVSVKNIRIDNPLLTPEVGITTVTADIHLEFPAASGCSAPITMEYRGSGPSYASIVMSPATESFTFRSQEDSGHPFVSPASETQVREGIKMTITTTRDAPAFQSVQYIFKATAKPSTSQSCNFNQGTSDQPVTVQNDYFPLIQANAKQTLLKSGQNAQVQFPVDVTNFGNGQTRVSVETSYLSKDQLASLVPPSPFVVDSKAQQGPSARDTFTAFIQARTPHSNGYTNSIYSFSADFSGEYAGAKPPGEPKTDEQTVTLSLQVQGVYAPGFDPVFAIGALGVAMLGVRRFMGRDEER